MWPKWHLLYSFVFVTILVYFFNFSLLAGLIIFLASILIDLDHILIYTLKKKDINPLRFWNWSKSEAKKYGEMPEAERENIKKSHFIFHGIEFILLISILAFFIEIFKFILIGFLFHLILDYIVIIYEKEHFAIKSSQIWLWSRNKKKQSISFNERF